MVYNSLMLAIMFCAKKVRGYTEYTDPTVVLVICAIALIVIVVAVVGTIGNNTRAREQQQAIDESHALYYNRWRKAIAMSGEIAPVSCNLILRDGEECLWVEHRVTLYEVRAVRHSSHTFGSIPVTRGIRVGRGYSSSESTDEWRPIAEGALYITNKQIYFDGDKQDRKIPLSKLSTIKADWSAIEVSSDTRQKSMVFVGVNGNVCRDIVLCANGQDIFSSTIDA